MDLRSVTSGDGERLATQRSGSSGANRENGRAGAIQRGRVEAAAGSSGPVSDYYTSQPFEMCEY